MNENSLVLIFSVICNVISKTFRSVRNWRKKIGSVQVWRENCSRNIAEPSYSGVPDLCELFPVFRVMEATRITANLRVKCFYSSLCCCWSLATVDTKPWRQAVRALLFYYLILPSVLWNWRLIVPSVYYCLDNNLMTQYRDCLDYYMLSA